jgi:acetyl-CoA/propionyl-CoA carboxylase biotin carboxyl carrier protein
MTAEEVAREVASRVRGLRPGTATYEMMVERFAKAVQDAGLIWIGPSPEVIDLMGSKIAAKKAAEKAKVPTLPWALTKGDDLAKMAKKVGYPLLLKASAGGGGRGMRLVFEEKKLDELAKAAMAEAQASFGSSEIFLESYKENARHVEVQILGDSHGTVITFGERDCSAQRRHQKVLEEEPAPDLSEKTRQKLWKAARDLASAVGYENAGTCEFLVDAQENIYFLEMNTRLQVEHPVTELAWGVDLVALQLKVAQGGKLPQELNRIKPRGHAIEARLYAENPAQQFMPSPGRITALQIPSGEGLRIDAGYETGDEVPIFYDAMLAKVIAFGQNREVARSRLATALRGIKAEGIITNASFLADLVEHGQFAKFAIHTKWIEATFKDWKPVSTAKPAAQAPSTASLFALPVHKSRPSPWVYYGSEGGRLASTSSQDGGVDSYTPEAEQGSITGPLVAENPGKVLSVKVKAGSKVASGDTVIVCESMKMEFSYSAPCDAVVKAVAVKEGQVVAAGAVLLEWETA